MVGRARSWRARREREGLEDLLLPFTDLITFLLAFFVIIYTTQSLAPEEAEALQASIRESMGQEATREVGYAELAARLERDISRHGLAGKTRIEYSLRGVELAAEGELLFDSGSAQLRPEARAFVARLATLVESLPYRIAVEGHTDSTPIQTSRFPSNWELSTARATEVVRFLIQSGVAPQRLAAAGYADTRPLSANVPAAQNRRVVFIFRKQH